MHINGTMSTGSANDVLSFRLLLCLTPASNFLCAIPVQGPLLHPSLPGPLVPWTARNAAIFPPMPRATSPGSWSVNTVTMWVSGANSFQICHSGLFGCFWFSVVYLSKMHYCFQLWRSACQMQMVPRFNYLSHKPVLEYLFREIHVHSGETWRN